MTDTVYDTAQINGLKVCVIVPTYNNHKTLKRVVDGVLQYTDNIIVVNDGSTDDTAQILSGYPQLTVIHLSKNSGKGIALRTGFKKALESGYHYALTIDSDGQHFPSDIPQFITAIENEQGSLLIGSRNMTQEGVPKKSSFGNKFSNFWFWFETGIRLEDTQSGYRLYPLLLIPKKYVTPKFEFEIEVIVRSAWKGIPVKNIPVQVLYNPAERVSHFRPFKDFTRISILNTVLVCITLLYIKPRDFIIGLKKKGVKRFFIEHVLHNEESKTKKALSISLGVFIGICPLWGFQTAAVIFLAVIFRLNKVISFAFSNVSIPPFIPLIIYGSVKTGNIVLGGNAPLFLSTSMNFSDIQNNIQEYLVGSIILATIMALLCGITGFFIMSVFSALKNKS